MIVNNKSRPSQDKTWFHLYTHDNAWLMGKYTVKSFILMVYELYRKNTIKCGWKFVVCGFCLN